MADEIPQLKDGSDWADHENCIVVNEQGLRNLMNACQVAIDKGAFYNNDLGDCAGVKMLASDWFQKASRGRVRTHRDQITHYRTIGNWGVQFSSVGALVYRNAKAAGLGHELPTEWFLQDIRY
jgi:hypothetical protein